nr:uncharacterized protein LOC119621189 [Chlorocebus sabaeus]
MTGTLAYAFSPRQWPCVGLQLPVPWPGEGPCDASLSPDPPGLGSRTGSLWDIAQPKSQHPTEEDQKEASDSVSRAFEVTPDADMAVKSWVTGITASKVALRGIGGASGRSQLQGCPAWAISDHLDFLPRPAGRQTSHPEPLNLETSHRPVHYGGP